MSPAVLSDLEKIEAFHYKREKELRDAAYNSDADNQTYINYLRQAEIHLKQAQTVRVCIVTIQTAEAREAQIAAVSR